MDELKEFTDYLEQKTMIYVHVKNKLVKQFEIFYPVSQQIAEKCINSTNKDMPIDYVANKLIELNNIYEEFTIDKIYMERKDVNNLMLFDHLIEPNIIKKCMILKFNKKTLVDIIFNKTCLELGWFVK